VHGFGALETALMLSNDSLRIGRTSSGTMLSPQAEFPPEHPPAVSMTGWLRRAAALVPFKDRVELLTPPVLVEKFVRYALADRKRHVPADDIDARDPELTRLLLDFFRAVGRHYFRLKIRGVENVPSGGPVLLVGNHNGALLPTDGFFTALAIWDRFGPSRAVFALAHDFLFHDPTLRRYAQALGMLRAGHESARRVFARGGIVLVYPGSDLDAFRPWRERHRVVLGDRTGFLRLALRARVPIVPVVSAGTHEQLIVLTRGDRLARVLHMHRWARTLCCPIVFSLPWGITSGFVPYFPLPAQTTIAFGRPMEWPDLDPTDADDPVAIGRIYREVEAAMQAMLDDLSVGRRPFLGQPG
jgi:1-acyl-sn-glycerol-3-phosphate acyltransferase